MKIHIGRAPSAAFLCTLVVAAAGCSAPQPVERPASPPPYREVPAPGYGFGTAGGYQPARPADAAAAQQGEVRSIEAPRRAASTGEAAASRGAGDGPWRIVVRLADGTQRSFELSQASEWRVGDKVRVVDNQLVRE